MLVTLPGTLIVVNAVQPEKALEPMLLIPSWILIVVTTWQYDIDVCMPNSGMVTVYFLCQGDILLSKLGISPLPVKVIVFFSASQCQVILPISPLVGVLCAATFSANRAVNNVNKSFFIFFLKLKMMVINIWVQS